MEFFRHQTDAGRGRSMTKAFDEFGHFGYAAWFLILELYYEKLKTRDKEYLSKCARSSGLWFGFHPRVLRQHLHTTPAKLRRFLDYCQTNGLLLFRESPTTIEISICNLLELLDPKAKKILAEILEESSGVLEEMRGDEMRGDENVNASPEAVTAKAGRTTKKTTSRGKPKKGTENSEAIAFFCDLWKIKYKADTSPNISGKEAGIIRRMVDTMGIKKTKKFMEAYFQMPDAWIVKQAHPINLMDTKKMEIHRFMQSGAHVRSSQVRDIERKQGNKELFELFEGDENAHQNT